MSEIEHFKQKVDRSHYRVWQVCWVLMSGLYAFISFVLIDIFVERTYSILLGILIWILISIVFLKLLEKGISVREYGLDERRLYFTQALIKDEPMMELRKIQEIILPNKGRFVDLYTLPYSRPNIILYTGKNHQAALGVEDLDAFLLALRKRLPNVPVRDETEK